MFAKARGMRALDRYRIAKSHGLLHLKIIALTWVPARFEEARGRQMRVVLDVADVAHRLRRDLRGLAFDEKVRRQECRREPRHFAVEQRLIANAQCTCRKLFVIHKPGRAEQIEHAWPRVIGIFANADALGVDPARIAVAGESAGAGMAAAVALMIRDRGASALCAQILTYPMLDHRTGGPDCPWCNPVTGEFVWTRAHNRFGWDALRGNYALDDERIGWFSPSRAADLSGLPPTWIGVGGLDLFLDENFDYARRLIASGVSTEFHCYAGAPHGFNILAATQVSQALNRDLIAATRRLVGKVQDNSSQV
jgi:hypothetical protein